MFKKLEIFSVIKQTIAYEIFLNYMTTNQNLIKLKVFKTD